MAGELISVAQAAGQLGVSPQRVHQRIQDGSLPAERIGRSWAIDVRDVRRAARKAQGGRPMSPRSAWALISLAAGVKDAGLSASQRSNARARLRNLIAHHDSDNLEDTIALLLPALRGRAQRRELSASSMDLADLRNDPRVHLSGVSLPQSRMASGGMVEGYVQQDELSAVLEDYLLSPAAHDQVNVVLHMIPSSVDPPLLDALDVLVGSPLALVADLAEHDDVRENSEALRALGEVRVDG